MGVSRLVKKMMDIINYNTPQYHDFFNWHGYYSFHEINVDNERYDGICDLCTLVNNKTRRSTNLFKFWNSLSNNYDDNN